jgi:hypothetical protein
MSSKKDAECGTDHEGIPVCPISLKAAHELDNKHAFRVCADPTIYDVDALHEWVQRKTVYPHNKQPIKKADLDRLQRMYKALHPTPVPAIKPKPRTTAPVQRAQTRLTPVSDYLHRINPTLLTFNQLGNLSIRHNDTVHNLKDYIIDVCKWELQRSQVYNNMTLVDYKAKHLYVFVNSEHGITKVGVKFLTRVRIGRSTLFASFEAGLY